MNENIVKTTYKDKEIYLVKTAHVSKNSVADVDECVSEVKPDTICIELDKDRYNTLKNKDGETKIQKTTGLYNHYRRRRRRFLLPSIPDRRALTHHCTMSR